MAAYIIRARFIEGDMGVYGIGLKIRVPIYLFLSVGRKMTPFPETVSDPMITPFVGHFVTVNGNIQCDCCCIQ